MPQDASLRRGSALCVIALLCALSLLFNLQWVRAYLYRGPVEIDNIAVLEARLGALKSFFPSRGVANYRSDREVSPYIVQHALAPMQLSNSPDAEWLVVNFHEGQSISADGYELVASDPSFSGGVALLRRAP